MNKYESLEIIRHRGWLFSIPRIYNGNRITIKYIVSKLKKYDYFVFQLEKGEKTGYRHYQLYLEHANALKKSTLVKLFPMAHIEPRERSKKALFDYCTKKESRLHGYWEFGERPDFNEVGTNTSARASLVADIAKGLSDLDLLLKYPTIFTKKVVDEYRSILGVKDYYLTHNRDIEVYYVYGQPGLGKSSFVRKFYDVDNIYVVSDYEKDPFGSYNGEDVIVFEEYRHNFVLSIFLQYLDRYPLMLPARYSNKIAKFTKVFIISNWIYNLQYSHLDNVDRKAFYRRIKYVYEVERDFISRYTIENSFTLIKEGCCYNPIGMYSESFPEYEDFNDLNKRGFN